MEYQYLVKNGVELAKDLCLHLKSSDWLPFREIQIPGCDNGRVDVAGMVVVECHYRDWETDRKSVV